jgi:hypothetical protein
MMKIPLPPSVQLIDSKGLSRYKKKWEGLSSLDRRKEEWQTVINTQYERDLFELSTDVSKRATFSGRTIGTEGDLD